MAKSGSFSSRFPHAGKFLFLALVIGLGMTVFSVQKVSTSTQQHAAGATCSQLAGSCFYGQCGNGYSQTGTWSTCNPNGNYVCCKKNTTFTISGNVFNDINRNGFKDTNEKSFQGIQVTISGAASRTTTTNSYGNYTFTNNPSGAYTVTVKAPNYLYRVSTSNQKAVTLGPGVNVNFGIYDSLTPVPHR